MAQRTGVLAKLKLVYTYADGAGETKERNKTFYNLKPDQAAANVLAAANALGSLQADEVSAVREIAEYDITETA